MDRPSHEDFLLQELWRSLSDIELCIFESQEIILSADRGISDAESEILIVDIYSYIDALEVCKEEVRREIVTAARDACEDSSYEDDDKILKFHEEIFTRSHPSSHKWNEIIKESKECVNALRVLIEKPMMQSKNGKWIKTHRGCELENAKTLEVSEYGRLKRDFDKQTSNIIILERERNEMSVQIEVLQTQVNKCKCSKRKVRFK